MTTNTIVLIVVVALVAILLIAAIAWVARNKRTQHRRVEAGDIGREPLFAEADKAAEQSHKVGQREALADETAAKRAAPLKPRPTPRQRTRRAYSTKRKCVAATRPPPATR